MLTACSVVDGAQGALVLVWFFILTRPGGERDRIGPFTSREACKSTRQTIELNLPGSARFPCFEQRDL